MFCRTRRTSSPDRDKLFEDVARNSEALPLRTEVPVDESQFSVVRMNSRVNVTKAVDGPASFLHATDEDFDLAR